jgi:hypothetical protein
LESSYFRERGENEKIRMRWKLGIQVVKTGCMELANSYE